MKVIRAAFRPGGCCSLAVITHHNAIESHSARMEGRPPESLHASVAELRPPIFPVGSGHLEHLRKTSIVSGDFVSLTRWLTHDYGSPRLRISITPGIRAACCMKRLPRSHVARICCCSAEI